MFKQRFGYITEIIELNNTKKPQLQLNLGVSNFVYKHNGPHNLLIVYYTGHASYNEKEEQLVLHWYIQSVHNHFRDVQGLTVDLDQIRASSNCPGHPLSRICDLERRRNTIDQRCRL